MSVVPQAAFAAKKIRQNEEKLFERNDLSPTKYSSKYMNSIWGMYNRYSVHNLKKNMDAVIPAMGQQREIVGSNTLSAEKTSADVKGSLVSAKNFLAPANFL